MNEKISPHTSGGTALNPITVPNCIKTIKTSARYPYFPTIFWTASKVGIVGSVWLRNDVQFGGKKMKPNAPSDVMGEKDRKKKFEHLCVYFSLRFNNRSLLNPTEHKTTIIVELRYNRRLPIHLTLNRKQQLPAILTTLKMVAKYLASTGIPKAFSTWIMYDRQMIHNENSRKKFRNSVKMNGFSVRFRFNSFNLSKNDGLGCEHSINCLVHGPHVFATTLWFRNLVNSSFTYAADTQPRSHCNDWTASFGRSRDNSQLGDSG